MIYSYLDRKTYFRFPTLSSHVCLGCLRLFTCVCVAQGSAVKELSAQLISLHKQTEMVRYSIWLVPVLHCALPSTNTHDDRLDVNFFQQPSIQLKLANAHLSLYCWQTDESAAVCAEFA